MLPNALNQFYSEIEKSKDLYEIELANRIREHPLFLNIKNRNYSDKEKELQIQVLLRVFSEHFIGSCDKIGKDYTFGNFENNLPWINLAKKIAQHTNRNYISILIPDFNRAGSDFPLYTFICVEEAQKQWYLVDELISKLEKNEIASSISMLQRMKLKNPYPYKNKKSPWEYVETEVIPKWRNNAPIPYRLPFIIQELIESYIKEDYPLFNQVFKCLDLQLHRYSKEEINNFFALTVKSKSLISILLACFNREEDCKSEELQELARWLCRYNPAMIIKTELFEDIYRKEKLGKFFTIQELKEQVQILEIERMKFKAVSEKDTILPQISKSVSINDEVMKSIKKFFHSFFNDIASTNFNYLHKTALPAMQKWIHLAQCLEGAGHVLTAYHLLLPITCPAEDALTGERITIFPLSNCILSDDCKSLIPMDNVLLSYGKEGFPYYYSEINSELKKRVLTNTEITSIQFAEDSIWLQFNKLRNRTNNYVIQEPTYDALFEMVETIFFAQGISGAYNEHQLELADAAWDRFCRFYRNMDEQERVKLNAQYIIFKDQQLSFKDILEKVAEEHGCITTKSVYFSLLLLNYGNTRRLARSKIKDIQFTNKIAEWTYIQPKVLQPLSIDDSKALRRMLVIMVSVMVNKFKKVGPGNSIDYYDNNNEVTDSGLKIFKFIDSFLQSNQTNAGEAYCYLINIIVNGLLENKNLLKSFKDRFFRYPETNTWLSDIKLNILPISETCFEPKLIFITLFDAYRNSQESSLDSDIKLSIEDIELSQESSLDSDIKLSIKDIKLSIENVLKRISSYATRPNIPANDFWVIANIAFNKFLLKIQERKMVLNYLINKLNQSTKEVNADIELEYDRALTCFVKRNCSSNTSIKIKGLPTIFGASPKGLRRQSAPPPTSAKILRAL